MSETKEDDNPENLQLLDKREFVKLLGGLQSFLCGTTIPPYPLPYSFENDSIDRNKKMRN